MSTAACVLADRAEITNYFLLDNFAQNSTNKSFRSNYLCFYTELKYMDSKLRVLNDRQKTESTSLNWKASTKYTFIMS